MSQEEDLIGPGYARSLQRFVVVLSSSFFLLTEGKAENFTFIFVTFLMLAHSGNTIQRGQ